MIDIHTHVLFGVDDGAKTIEDSLAMLKAFEKNGVTAVFLTPHIAPKRGYNQYTDDLMIRFNELKTATKKANINIDLYLGSEIDETDQLYELLEQGPTMNNTKFVLLDFGMRKADIEEIVYECTIKGYRVIVAHPERYHHFSYDQLIKLKKQGALFQVSAPHLIKLGSKDAQKKAKQLLKDDLIDFVASDAHHPMGMQDTMKEAYRYVTKKKGEDVANNLFYRHAKTLLIDKD